MHKGINAGVAKGSRLFTVRKKTPKLVRKLNAQVHVNNLPNSLPPGKEMVVIILL